MVYRGKERPHVQGSAWRKRCLNAAMFGVTVSIFVILIVSVWGCATVLTREIKDEISHLSFSHDGKKFLFDRCRAGNCQIQVYDLGTGELSAYQSPANERWTMAKHSYDGKKIVFAVMPMRDEHLELADMQIAVMDPDGKNLKKITTGQGAKLYPVFSHSGKKVLYARAAYMRKKGATPAAQYDAWEVDLETGEQTQLTYFKYFYMAYLTYFPDDERFIYYGEMPEAFPGIKEGDKEALNNKFRELAKKGISLHATVVMKGKKMIPRLYDFDTYPRKPLLSQDGSRLLFEKGFLGTFYLYSPDGNHRRLGGGGSLNSAAISPDGELLGVNYDSTVNIYSVKDGKLKVQFYILAATRIENWDDNNRKYPREQKMIPELPSRIYSE